MSVTFNSVAPEPVLWDRKRGINTREYTYFDWLNKLAEEIAESRQVMNEGERLEAIRELCDARTIITSWMYQLGASRELVNRLQAEINDKNRSRGALAEHL